MTNPLEELSLDDLRLRTSSKWRRYGAEVLPLWVAEMDVPLAEPIAAALNHAVAIGDTGYCEGTAYGEALAAFARARWGWCFDVAASANAPDVLGGLAALLRLVTSPGDAVVVNSPVYPPFYHCIEDAERRVIEAPLNAAHRIDAGNLDRAFRLAAGAGRGGAFVLCSPHNPTGTVHTREELKMVIQVALRHGVRVIADEIHAPIVYPGAEHVPYLSLAGSERSFALLSASKGWNLAGLKAALVVAGDDATDDLARLPVGVRHGASHVGVIAHVAALRDGGPWLDRLLAGLDANRLLLAALLREQLPDIAYNPPQGTFLAWLDCRALGLTDDPAEVFLERGLVALNTGPSFGTGGAGHARLNLATSPEILADAVSRMAAALR